MKRKQNRHRMNILCLFIELDNFQYFTSILPAYRFVCQSKRCDRYLFLAFPQTIPIFIVIIGASIAASRDTAIPDRDPRGSPRNRFKALQCFPCFLFFDSLGSGWASDKATDKNTKVE